jgi:hypothetical protein
MLMPFIDMVFNKPTGNAVRGVLSIGKDYLSLQIPFTLLISNIICTYKALGNTMSGSTAECTGQRIQHSRRLGIGAGAGMGCCRLLQHEHFEEGLCHLLE